MIKQAFSSPEDKEEFVRILSPILRHPEVKRMKCFIQHGRISTYEHCLMVALTSQKLNRRFKLNADSESLLTGAMLHDFYLYDWHAKDGGSHDWHGFIHAERARKNAVYYFHISPQVQSIIYSHMWPLNLFRVPKSKEAWIVCLADKLVSLKETLFMRSKVKDT